MSSTSLVRSLFVAIVLSTLIGLPVFAQKSEVSKPAGAPVLWRDPGDISRRNLSFGPGSAELAPVAPVFSVVAPCVPGAARRNLLRIEPIRATSGTESSARHTT